MCLSDVDVPCERVPLITELPGWYAKLELFHMTGPVLYFDLDTVITGDLSEIASYPHQFTMLRDFTHPEYPASGVMAWHGDYGFLFDKLHWRGGWLIAVPPQNTSRTCPCCGHVSAENRKTQAGFVCVECGFEENADVVGAINVLRAGHARFACEVSDAAGSPAAGTHRSDSGAAQCRA